MSKLNSRKQKPVERKAYTIPEFCEAYHVSRSKLYDDLKRGHGPRIMKVGRRTLISVEAATAWRRRLEASSRSGVHTNSKDGI